MLKESLEELAFDFNGTVQFAWVDANAEEKLKLAYHAYSPPRSHFIGATGVAYAFEPIVTYVPLTTEWI